MYSAPKIVSIIFMALRLLIIVRIIFSWIMLRRGSNDFVDFVYDITDPILKPLRVIIPLGNAGLDLSPIIAFFILGLVEQIILRLLI
ncbi:MAG: YggT family protein [Candidatus Muiribacterium halophilum]|uniref:YggT family protein n=1 Tax=Muiribacterium halophilum TaxID=2053465 RepID=A0A2N5Z9F9_MUIH1|nr:MAG: YggT family protein [Candidatus Muirbacterium halophilum]